MGAPGLFGNSFWSRFKGKPKGNQPVCCLYPYLETHPHACPRMQVPFHGSTTLFCPFMIRQHPAQSQRKTTQVSLLRLFERRSILGYPCGKAEIKVTPQISSFPLETHTVDKANELTHFEPGYLCQRRPRVRPRNSQPSSVIPLSAKCTSCFRTVDTCIPKSPAGGFVPSAGKGDVLASPSWHAYIGPCLFGRSGSSHSLMRAILIISP